MLIKQFVDEGLGCDIPLGAPLITWAGWVVPFGSPLILVADGPEERIQAVRQLVRIGYDDLRGYLEGGVAAWQAAGLPVEQVPVKRADHLPDEMARRQVPIVPDVRQDAGWLSGGTLK
jgi:hydroxyacylglutathione hydrolase